VRVIDISQPLGVNTAVWPGDHGFDLAWSMRQDHGDSVNVAVITMSVHTGTHTDGGYHVAAHGTRAAGLPLEGYPGRALVIDARGHPALDEELLDDVDLKRFRRLLFRTRDHVDAAQFPATFIAPTEALAHRMAAAGVKLMGTDAPSVDAFDSRDLAAHHILLQGGLVWLENLVLDNVAPGEYTLIALPLKLVDADSSPVRAVLIEGSMDE